ncbi:class I SAM-dependent methyltransferase [Candidatus Neptunichlamydia sp. REUL1]|uniref:class I SAM-dependent methyltransferase n=1 Tax=Candidatus Neptunichlamydia sp. REUL1 TaxID=3064277 RepID=UPI00292D55F9|nr:class I SAM-dependent methyltransferase [Candidatus Neptunochlamydia sp. REUL1]
MGQEIDLLINYPKTKRDVKERGATKTEEDRAIARQFGKDFFDGDRRHGYGGFGYMERFWTPVVPTFQNQYNLTEKSSVLDIGAAKGFMLYDFRRLIPNITIAGCDVSDYAIKNAKEEVKPFLKTANAIDLPYKDNSFDLVISINTVHNLEKPELASALQEIERVSRGNSFITVDAYRNEQEKELMYHWNLTAKTIMHVDEWKSFFNDIGYTGDYYWFIP